MQVTWGLAEGFASWRQLIVPGLPPALPEASWHRIATMLRGAPAADLAPFADMMLLYFSTCLVYVQEWFASAGGLWSKT